MAILIIDGYHYFFSKILSAVLGSTCRFTPTCSCYSRDAFKIYGFRLGLVKTLKRLARCHPWGGHGYDPVEENFKQRSKEVVTRGI